MQFKYLIPELTRLIKCIPLWFKYRADRASVVPAGLVDNTSLSPLDLKRLTMEPFHWYHNYAPLGITTKGHTPANQTAKQEVLFPYIDQAIELCKRAGAEADGAELFCADGYFSNYAVRAGAASMYGNDTYPLYIQRSRLISRVLGNQRKTTFKLESVFDMEGTYDFIVCAGGLYHLPDPERLIAKLRANTRHVLIIQSACINREDEAGEYFESPAENRPWGSRFSPTWLRKMVERNGWKVIREDVNELPENPAQARDPDSAYLLCVPREEP